MKDRLFKLLGIESGEESMVTMLLMQSVFLGIFFGAFDISAHSLFLSIFDEKMMARGYVLSGLAGILLTAVYTRLQTRMLFRRFATINLGFVTTITLVLWLLLTFMQAKWVVILVFIMLGPLNILAMLGFWGTVGRIFTLRQGKRLFGLVDSGLIIGIIISCYAIPVLLSLSFKPHNILLVSAAAVLTGSVIQMMIGTRFLSSTSEEKESGPAPKKRSVAVLFREDPYIRIMAIFIALSVMTAFFVQYSFMAVTREQYPAEDDMARFLGLFTGSMMIFTLLIKLLVFAYLIRNYGLRTCLAMSPILVAAFTIIAIIIGWTMGFTPASNGFLLFFMLLALSRLFSKSLKDSIESPSFKVIYQTIDEKIRFGVQSGMDGTVNEIAALSSGLILAGLGILSFIKLIHFPIVLLLMTLLWMLVAIKLYSGYRNSIKKALESGGNEESEREATNKKALFNNRFSAGMAFRNEYFNLITGDQESLVKYGNRHFFFVLLDHAESQRDINLIPVLKSISVYAGADQEIRQRATRVAESLELLSASFQAKDDRMLNAQRILADSRQPQTTQILRLLRDNSTESKKLAIYMIGKFRLTDMISEVCECLNIQGLEVDAANVLRSFGEDADANLCQYYMISSGNTRISKTILHLLGESCRKENQNFLFSRLWSNSRLLKEIALRHLAGCNFKSSGEERDKLHQLISDVVGIMVWNLSAKISLQRKNDAFLLEILNREIARWNLFLFNILSITYDSGSISRIRENLESGTVASVNYALEMIDMVIDESVKPRLIPLLDVIPEEEKLKSLFQFYPGEIPDYQHLIEDFINRDYNLLGIWTRACVIRNLQEIESDSLAESIVALLFSPEAVLQEESARLLARSGREIYSKASFRIPAKAKSRLDKIISSTTPSEALLYEKVRFLSACFRRTEEDNLLVLAENMLYIKSSEQSMLPPDGGFIIWPVNGENNGHDVKIVFEQKKEDVMGRLDHSYLLPLDSVEKFCYRFPEQSGEILNYIEINVK
jgi:ATP/ADP translocase